MKSHQFLPLIIAVVMVGSGAVCGNAQNNSREFIESSSPLANGDRVVSRSEEGRAVQTVITVSAESLARSSQARQQQSIASQRIDLTAGREDSSGANATPTLSGASAENQSSADRYPYPAANRIASNANLRGAGTGNVASSAYQLPTLGIGSLTTARRAQLYQDCNCNPQTFGFGRAPVPAAQAPSLPVQPPALNIQDPGQAGVYQQPFVQQPAYQQTYFNSAPQPQFGFQNNNRWWTPFVTGSGVYQPIVRLANVKPGTYLGQGIIGQPTAYVDGQPVRNLMRYIFP